MKSGNLTPYRVNLIEKVGQDEVDFIEGPHDAKKYTLDEIKEIETYYKAKCRELEKQYEFTA